MICGGRRDRSVNRSTPFLKRSRHATCRTGRCSPVSTLKARLIARVYRSGDYLLQQRVVHLVVCASYMRTWWSVQADGFLGVSKAPACVPIACGGCCLEDA